MASLKSTGPRRRMMGSSDCSTAHRILSNNGHVLVLMSKWPGWADAARRWMGVSTAQTRSQLVGDIQLKSSPRDRGKIK